MNSFIRFFQQVLLLFCCMIMPLPAYIYKAHVHGNIILLGDEHPSDKPALEREQTEELVRFLAGREEKIYLHIEYDLPNVCMIYEKQEDVVCSILNMLVAAMRVYPKENICIRPVGFPLLQRLLVENLFNPYSLPSLWGLRPSCLEQGKLNYAIITFADLLEEIENSLREILAKIGEHEFLRKKYQTLCGQRNSVYRVLEENKIQPEDKIWEKSIEFFLDDLEVNMVDNQENKERLRVLRDQFKIFTENYPFQDTDCLFGPDDVWERNKWLMYGLLSQCIYDDEDAASRVEWAMFEAGTTRVKHYAIFADLMIFVASFLEITILCDLVYEPAIKHIVVVGGTHMEHISWFLSDLGVAETSSFYPDSHISISQFLAENL